MSAVTSPPDRARQQPTYVRLGLTGAIGAGKSSVARLLAARGAVVIDADALARRAADDPAVLARIAREVGADLVGPTGLDRAATARRVFADPAARRALEAIIHPFVRAAAAAAEAAALAAPAAAASPAGVLPADPPTEPLPTPRVIVHDVPLLFESGLDAGMDATLVVTAPFALRAQRLAARSGLTPDAVRGRDAAQLPPEEKARRATFVLDNAGDEAALATAVAEIWPRLLACARPR